MSLMKAISLGKKYFAKLIFVCGWKEWTIILHSYRGAHVPLSFAECAGIQEMQ
jgi:hypothetical protein